MSACALSREGAKPCSTSNLSRRFFILSGGDFPSTGLCSLLYRLLPGYFSLVVSVVQRRMGSAPAMPDKTPNPIGQPERSSIRDASQTDRMADGTTSAVADDSVLLQRVRQGDQTAMAEVFDRYGRAVYSVALRILKDSGHAEDVMQEIFFQIWRNSDSFVQGRGSLGAWLVVVARNRSIDMLRRRKPGDSVDDGILASPGNLA